MNYLRSLFLIAGFTVALIGCKKEKEEKKPLADFTADKSDYFTGEIIQLTNSSKDAVTYRWTLPDGQTSKSKDITWYTDAGSGDQTLSFKLEAFSSSSNKSDFIQKNIKLKAGIGSVVLYITNPNYVNPIFSISIDGQTFKNYNMQKQSSVPDCWAQYCATFDLSSGPHSWSATWGSSVFAGTMIVKSGTCTKVEIK